MKKRINISIDTDIHERAQRHAFRRGISLSNFIETELCRAMKKPEESDGMIIQVRGCNWISNRGNI